MTQAIDLDTMDSHDPIVVNTQEDNAMTDPATVAVATTTPIARLVVYRGSYYLVERETAAVVFKQAAPSISRVVWETAVRTFLLAERVTGLCEQSNVWEMVARVKGVGAKTLKAFQRALASKLNEIVPATREDVIRVFGDDSILPADFDQANAKPTKPTTTTTQGPSLLARLTKDLGLNPTPNKRVFLRDARVNGKLVVVDMAQSCQIVITWDKDFYWENTKACCEFNNAYVKAARAKGWRAGYQTNGIWLGYRNRK